MGNKAKQYFTNKVKREEFIRDIINGKFGMSLQQKENKIAKVMFYSDKRNKFFFEEYLIKFAKRKENKMKVCYIMGNKYVRYIV